MTRIYVSNGCKELYENITNALDAEYIDYDMDGYDRYMIAEDDTDESKLWIIQRRDGFMLSLFYNRNLSPVPYFQ